MQTKRKFFALLVVVCVTLSQNVLANNFNFCSDIVVDEAGLLNSSELAQVSDAAQKLKTTGVDVRVQTLPNLHGQPSLKALNENFISKCGSWRAKDGGMKNNLVVMMLAPKQGKLEIFYGDGLKQKLDGKTVSVQQEIAAKYRDGNVAGGLVTGLNDVGDLVQIKISQQGAPVTITHPADMSGLWTILGWVLGLGVLAGMIFIGLKLSGEKARRRNAQNNAKTEKSRCSGLVNSFDSSIAILISKIKQDSAASETKKAKLLADANDVKARQSRAQADFASINRSGNDPDIPNLSVDEYESIAARYTKIGNTLDSLSLEMSRIESLLKSPEIAQTAKPAEEAPTAKQVHPDTGTSGKPHRDSGTPKHEKPQEHRNQTAQTSSPASSGYPHSHDGGHTTIVNNTTVQHDDGGLLTGILIGQALGDHHEHHHYDAPPPRYEAPPAPSSSGRGVETDLGSSSMGNGVETDLGFSSKGNGVETSLFGGADFGRSRDPEPEVERSRDCAPSDCRPSDCKPSDCDCTRDCAASDCRSSDCNCDCNCDCSSAD